MIPVYICTGFLDSGKTTFIKDTLMEQEWIQPGNTLYLQCEEGEFCLPEEYMRLRRIITIPIQEPAQLTRQFLQELTDKYCPAQIVIEFNGMWDFQVFLQADYPKSWGLAGIYSTIDGSMLEMYLKNMRNLLMNQVAESELIVINRTDPAMPRASFRNAVRIQNPGTQLIFEDKEGNIIDTSEEELPYDVRQSSIELSDDDYGVWYADACENPERYLKKEIRFLAQVMRPIGMSRNMFVPGRLIMTCCADDVKFYGFPCRADAVIKIQQRGWAYIAARFEMTSGSRRGDRPQPILRLIKLDAATAPNQVVVTL